MQSSATRSHYVDVLRGFAATAVLISHADVAHLVDIGLSSIEKGFLGAVGVYVFFILSGFLIWKSARVLDEPGGLGIYAVHRATRLVPLYLVNILFALFMVGSVFPSAFVPSPTIAGVLRHLTFMQDLVPVASREINPVLWTLTHEVLYYALVPLLVRTPLPAIAVLGVVSYVWAAAMPANVFTTFLTHFYLFTVGIFLAERRSVLAALVLLLVTAVRFAHLAEWLAWIVPCAGAIVVVGLALPGRALWLTAPLRWIGVISFSVYIWHYLLVNMLGTTEGFILLEWLIEGATKNRFVSAVLTLIIVFGVSTASYWLIERPSMGRLRTWLLGRTCAHHQASKPAPVAS